MYIPRPLGQQQTISTTAPCTWDFRQEVPRLGKKLLHVAAIQLDINLPVTQANTADAIGVFDYPLFITSLQFERDPQRPILNALPGNLLLAYQCMTANGVARGLYPTGITAKSGSGGGTTNKYFRFVIPFDRPYLNNKRFEDCWPLAALIKQGKLAVQFGVPSGSTGITVGTGGACDATLLCVGLDDVEIPPDTRWEMIDSATNTTQKGILFPSGTYAAIIYDPYKWSGAGGDDLSNVTIDGTPYAYGNAFRSQRAIPSSSAIGNSYVEQYLAANVLDMTDTSAINLVRQSKIVPLWAPSAFADKTKTAFVASQDWKLDVNVSSGTLAAGHRFLIGRIFSITNEERATIAQVAGIPSATVQKKVMDGRPLAGNAKGQGLKPHRQKLVGEKLVVG